MRSRMDPKYYLSSEIFELEQKKLFRKVWLFAGIKTLLTKHNAFLSRKIAGIPIVIQNFYGELHAFENVCLHRSAQIQTEPVGIRPLVCRYHGWSYDAHGRVANIPDCDAIYRFDDAERQGLILREFALRAVGNVLFVNLDQDPLALEDQFSTEFIDLLERSSQAWDTEVMMTTWQCKFNWKLAYENLRDANHPRFIHPKSLARTVCFTPSVIEAQAEETLCELPDTTSTGLRREICRFSYAGADAQIPDLKKLGWHALVDRWGDQDSYYNWLAFPNMHIASANGGFSFTIEHHIPVSPDRTDLEIYWFAARKKRSYAFSNQVLLAQMHGSKLVVGEDVNIMETVQTALHMDAPFPSQGAYESMNRLVERWYTTLMETRHEI
jgi:carnitine monooxygenase subunit